jgi:hypothetical protein
MGNKRQFKKYVSALASGVCEDMMITYFNVEGVDAEKVNNSINTILDAASHAADCANLGFDRTPRSFEDRHQYAKARRAHYHALFNKLRNDYSEAIDRAIKEFNSAVPANAKENNRKLAAEA